MILHTSDALEFRGAEQRTGKTGKPYVIVHLEEQTGNHVSYISRNPDVAAGIVKGETVSAWFEVNRYGNLSVTQLHRPFEDK